MFDRPENRHATVVYKRLVNVHNIKRLTEFNQFDAVATLSCSKVNSGREVTTFYEGPNPVRPKFLHVRFGPIKILVRGLPWIT